MRFSFCRSTAVFGQANQSGTLSRIFRAIVERPFFRENYLENAVKSLLISKGLDENLPLRNLNDSSCETRTIKSEELDIFQG
jgi:hypothetical protein